MFDSFDDFIKQFGPGDISRFFPRVMYRLGGNLLAWAEPGSASFSPVSTIMQVGCSEWDKIASTSDTHEVDFKAKYAGAPLVFVHPVKVNPTNAGLWCWSLPATDKFTIYWKSDVAVTEIFFAWLAIGGQLQTAP